MWQGESGRNTQFGTNCGRLPAAFAVPTLRTFVSENSSGVQMSNFMEIIHDFKTSKNNTILLFVYITYFINFATKLYMLIYE